MVAPTVAGMTEIGELARAMGRTVPDDQQARKRLADALRAAVASAPPSVPISWERLARVLSRVMPDASLDAVADRELAYLHLAEASLEGNEAAIGEVKKLLIDTCAEVLGARGFSRDEIDEVSQALIVRLLIGSDERLPSMTSYSGRGRLGGFFRAAVMRAGLNARRDDRRREKRALQAQLEEVFDDPETRHLKERYLEMFRDALKEAWESLDPERQLLLRYQLEDGLSVDDLARLLGVHRSTAARRLAAAREALAAETRSQLKGTLGLADRDVESVMMLIHSRLGDAADALPGGNSD